MILAIFGYNIGTSIYNQKYNIPNKYFYNHYSNVYSNHCRLQPTTLPLYQLFRLIYIIIINIIYYT